MKRRRCAIMAVDVAGYSALMARDEAGTVARLQAILDAIFGPAVRAGGGRIVKLMGDGALVEFPGVDAALGAACRIQDALACREASRDAEDRIRLRIGINAGAVIVSGRDIFGDDVNIAARLEALAPPGGVLLTSEAAAQVTRPEAFPIDDLGPLRLKGIARAIGVCALRRPGAPALGISHAGDTAPLPGMLQRPAVAVMPFLNFSGRADRDYFVDGLSEDLIAALSHWRSFPVIARASSFALGRREVDARAVGQALGARYVLSGSVREAGGRLRIAAQLVDAESTFQIWAERFDRPADDLFEIQDSISRRIAATVAPELESAEPRWAPGRSSDVTAWDHYVRGMHHFNLETCADNAAARACFAQALARDDSFAEAWARMAWTHLRDISEGCTQDRAEAVRTALRLVHRALEIDQASSVAHLCLGTAYIWSDRFEEGTAAAAKALELIPSYAHAALALGNRLDLLGRTEEGIAHMQAGLQLNPHDPQHRWSYLLFMSRAHVSLGDHDTALSFVRQALALKPDHAEVHFRLAVCLALTGQEKEAARALARCEALRPGHLRSREGWTPYREAPRNARFFAGLRRCGLMDEAGVFRLRTDPAY